MDDGRFNRPQRWYRYRKYTLKKDSDTWNRNMSEGRTEFLRLLKDIREEDKEKSKKLNRRKLNPFKSIRN